MDNPTPARLAPPSSPDTVSGLYWRPNPEFVDELSKALLGRRVLEIFAGNGYLAGLLSARGVEVTATSVLSSMDAHDKGLYHEVLPLDAVSSVARFESSHDLLLICWPTVTRSVLEACELWGSERPIAFIGEFTDYAKGHLGGCATDEFFERFRSERTFSTYQGNMLEAACLGRLLPAPTPIPHRGSRFP